MLNRREEELKIRKIVTFRYRNSMKGNNSIKTLNIFNINSQYLKEIKNNTLIIMDINRIINHVVINIIISNNNTTTCMKKLYLLQIITTK